MSRIQQNIEQLIERLCAEGRERGIQVAAYRDGKLLVNAWAGIADARTGIPVTADTLFPVFSVTKGMTATIMHRLVERGLLAYATPVAEVWPEFGVNGKARITVEQVLRHTAGITKLPAGTSFADCLDWDGICRTIAGLTPEWAPGSRREYHGLTYGWILGEAAQRITGCDFAQLVQAEICAPLGLDTMYVGLPDAVAAEVAWLECPEAVSPTDDGTPQVVPFALQPLHAWMNRREAQRICAPAATGIMNAYAIARHYAALLPSGVDGVELLPPSRVEQATEALTLPPITPDAAPTTCAMGYSLGQPGAVMGESPAIFGHGGHGGSTGFADRSCGLGVGLAHNLFSTDDVVPEILAELRRNLD